MKNDIVFQFFQQKQKKALFPANPAIVTTLYENRYVTHS